MEDNAAITITMGNEYAPDDPWGEEILCLRGDGRVTYANRHRGRAVTRSGKIAPSRASAIFSYLSASTFPEMPEHALPPGASAIELRVDRGEDKEEISFQSFFALKLPGYGDLVREFQSLAAALRKDDATALAEWGFQPDDEQ